MSLKIFQRACGAVTEYVAVCRCFEANLNGVYYTPEEEARRDQFRGIIWERWLGDESLKGARMMVRDRAYVPPQPAVDLPDDVRPLDIPEDP
ncbi:hypothetical protein PR048_018042 [Dryococelus australis]|uniref:Fibrinogen C-terminal domain-containing protein n=1 Tax=Dryococelus australis TaxID=614101 RepID=A0ABQ9HBA7_9NEOP|nr:hypothetical protein PR048_018042 [Dryococelus australis]